MKRFKKKDKNQKNLNNQVKSAAQVKRPQRKVRFSKLSLIIVVATVAVLGGAYYLYKSSAATGSNETKVVLVPYDAQTGARIQATSIAGYGLMGINEAANWSSSSLCLPPRVSSGLVVFDQCPTHNSRGWSLKYYVYSAFEPGYNKITSTAAVNPVGGGQTTINLYFTRPSSPSNFSVPSNLKISGISKTNATATWDKVGAPNYDIGIYSANGSPIFMKSLYDNNKYNLSGLKCGTKYIFAVTATEIGGSRRSPAATKSFATASCVSKPGAPNFSVSSGKNSLKAIWKPVAGAQYYNISNNGRVVKTKVMGSSYTVSGLKCNTNYSVSVTAVNPAGSAASSKKAKTSACSGPVARTVTVYQTVPRPQPTKPTDPSDIKPPTAPKNLKATEENGAVTLSWDPSTDNKGVKCYSIERQENGGEWTMLNDCESSTSYTDSTTAAETAYTYRVSALDEAGNGSDYAQIDIATSEFEANAFADQENTIVSEDGVVSVKIPEGALPEDAHCEIKISKDNAPSDHNLIAGVYKLECKTKSGDLIEKYNKPLEFTVKVAEAGKTALFIYTGTEWQDSGQKYNGEVQGYSFSTDQPGEFAVVAVKKGAGWIWIILSLLLLLILIGLIIWLIKRKRDDQDSDDSYDLGYFDPNAQSQPGQDNYQQDNVDNYQNPQQQQMYDQQQYTQPADPSYASEQQYAGA